MEMSNSSAVRWAKRKPRSLLTFNVGWMFKLAVGSKLFVSPFDCANAALLSSVSPFPARFHFQSSTGVWKRRATRNRRTIRRQPSSTGQSTKKQVRINRWSFGKCQCRKNDSFPSVTLAIPTQSQQANSQISAYTSNKHMQSLLCVDEPNPITSYFLRTYTKERTELFSFNFKLAFLWYCVIPSFAYLRLGLNIVESKFMKEVHKKPKAYLVGPLFSYVFDVQGLVRTLMALASLISILFSSPKDFLITVTEDVRQVICLICKENTVSVGEDMLRHLRKLAVNSYKLASCLINVHQKH